MRVKCKVIVTERKLTNDHLEFSYENCMITSRMKLFPGIFDYRAQAVNIFVVVFFFCFPFSTHKEELSFKCSSAGSRVER